jgi:hypothetical protein
MLWMGHVAGIEKTNAYKIALKNFAGRHLCRRPVGKRIILKVH